jgi:hypothetical protein
MMSSARFGDAIPIDFFTTTHRISGGVQTGPTPLPDLLNDQTQSYIMLSNVYVSPLDSAAEIGAHASVAYLSKENISFVIASAREIRKTDRTRFTIHEYEALATLPGCEVRGKFIGPHRLDLRTFSPAALDPFLVLTEASACLTTASEVVFRGEAILVNRSRLESLCLSE